MWPYNAAVQSCVEDLARAPRKAGLPIALSVQLRFPCQENIITLLRLDESGTISAIQFVDADKELTEIFEPKK